MYLKKKRQEVSAKQEEKNNQEQEKIVGYKKMKLTKAGDSNSGYLGKFGAIIVGNNITKKEAAGNSLPPPKQ